MNQNFSENLASRLIWIDDNYSDKSIAVFGNTKPHKDELKSLGGKYNPRLRHGAGWVFRKKNLSKVEDYVNTLYRHHDFSDDGHFPDLWIRYCSTSCFWWNWNGGDRLCSPGYDGQLFWRCHAPFYPHFFNRR